ncbi:MAG: TIR domain-containing protein, partial [Desulfobacterales bacterium]
MKVFLSHSTKDKDFVEKLADELRAKDFEPWLCEIDVLFGDDFVDEIEKGLKEADFTVLVWSPEAASSAWTGKEWRSVLAREIKESRTRLGIVLIRDAEIPELLRTKHRIDVRSDASKAIQQTVEWLTRHRDMRHFEKTGAAQYILDFKPTDFVGRTEYLEQLHSFLIEDRGKCLLWGGPGSGKSMIALKFAWTAQGAFDAVVFQHCGQRNFEEIGIELAERIGLDAKELPPDRQILEAQKWLTKRRTLLVLDDIWNFDVKELIPSHPLSVQSLSILFTSRQRTLPWVKPPRTIEVTSFLEQEAESLFQIYLGEELTETHHDALMDLAARVEQLPIAVAVAAEMLSRQFDQLNESAQALKLEELRNQIHDIPELLKQAIASQPEQERQLLRAMAICHPDGFWLPLAADISGLDEVHSRKSRDQLINASLVRPVDINRQRFRLHALLREQLLLSTELEQLQNNYIQSLYELFEDWENRWTQCQECLPEVIPAIQMLWKKRSINKTSWLAYWGFATGSRVGELTASLNILKQEESFWKDIENIDAKDNLQRIYGNQALILKAWGQLEEAMALLKKQEALCIELGNKDGLQRTYGNQAGILQAWGQLEEAMALLKKQEALCIELGNKDG